MEMKHTPAPWTIRDSDKVNPTASDRWVIECQTQFPDIKNTVAFCGFNPNANLIAAAPELLEALEAFVNYGKKVAWNEDNKLMVNAVAAISKAKGE
jgi:hypothetical protein